VLALEAKFAELQADFANLEKKAACMEVELAHLKAYPGTSPSDSSPQEDSKAWVQILRTSHGNRRLDVQLDDPPGPGDARSRHTPFDYAAPLTQGPLISESELTQLGVNFILAYATLSSRRLEEYC
jgi:hypothetical protein